MTKLPKLVQVRMRDHDEPRAAYPLTDDDHTLLVCMPKEQGECLCLLFGHQVCNGYKEETKSSYLNLNSVELKHLGELLIAIAIKHPRNQPVLIKDS